MKRLIIYLLSAFVAGALIFGWGYRRGAASVGIRSEVRIDTVFYERPQSYGFSEQLVTVNVPRLLFAPADTVVRVVEAVNGADSVQIEIPVRTLEYRDSTYYARVSGPYYLEPSHPDWTGSRPTTGPLPEPLQNVTGLP